MIPLLINILTPLPGSTEIDETEFTTASDALQEILCKSALSDGAGSKTLTEPLLLWFDRYGMTIVDHTLQGLLRDLLNSLRTDSWHRGLHGRCLPIILQTPHGGWGPFDDVHRSEFSLFEQSATRVAVTHPDAYAYERVSCTDLSETTHGVYCIARILRRRRRRK